MIAAKRRVSSFITVIARRKVIASESADAHSDARDLREKDTRGPIYHRPSPIPVKKASSARIRGILPSLGWSSHPGHTALA